MTFFFGSSIYFSSVMTTVADLKIKTALNSLEYLKGQAARVIQALRLIMTADSSLMLPTLINPRASSPRF
jgi:hypothetical protein